MESIYVEAQNYMAFELNEIDWVGNGPAIDAMDEATVEDALEHIHQCCDNVLQGPDDGSWPEYQGYDDTDFYDIDKDLPLINYMMSIIDDNHPWQIDLAKMKTIALLSSELEAAE
jgi:hypothetical protein